ncbi:undecaprenyl pyrophosphate synthetase [Asaia krungthepensis NRIC 0535]|uniref:Isoprenyl transferase n=2 Tax=Asaia krungthepensis TaxID=220990 RepID=A0ABQ0Q615_9PROT|nr:undecaprenyl pyrophosphate synthetase [Asaia krungthepensis NRIC 0535]
MDGNGRWARARGKPVMAGHRAGAEAVRRCVKAAIAAGVRYLTLYAFSSENWNRTAEEVSDLTSLLRFYLRHKVAELHEQNVRLDFIGDLSRFDAGLRAEIERARLLTARNTRLTMILALSYGARSDMLGAAKRLAAAVLRGEIEPEAMREEDFGAFLQTSSFPDPDLIVRTSGERRLSNFLLWESAYAELAFLDVMWPDFDESHFDALMADFARRERRFGKRLAPDGAL